MHAEAAVDPAGLVASATPHDTQIGFAPDVSFHDPEEQSDVVGMQRLAGGSHIVPVPQSEACTGHTVAASSPLARQQQRRVTALSDATHVEEASVLGRQLPFPLKYGAVLIIGTLKVSV